MSTEPQSPTLVVIEDNAADIHLLKHTLNEIGLTCHLVIYRDVPEALKGLDGQQKVPTAIILDLNLPSGDGFQILSFVRGSESIKDVPVAVITSSESPLDKSRSQEMGATFYLHKPTDLDQFVKIVGEVMTSILHPN